MKGTSKLFERKATERSDTDLDAFAPKTLRTVREHFKTVVAGHACGGVHAAKK